MFYHAEDNRELLLTYVDALMYAEYLLNCDAEALTKETLITLKFEYYFVELEYIIESAIYDQNVTKDSKRRLILLLELLEQYGYATRFLHQEQLELYKEELFSVSTHKAKQIEKEELEDFFLGFEIESTMPEYDMNLMRKLKVESYLLLQDIMTKDLNDKDNKGEFLYAKHVVKPHLAVIINHWIHRYPELFQLPDICEKVIFLLSMRRILLIANQNTTANGTEVFDMCTEIGDDLFQYQFLQVEVDMVEMDECVELIDALLNDIDAIASIYQQEEEEPKLLA